MWERITGWKSGRPDGRPAPALAEYGDRGGEDSDAGLEADVVNPSGEGKAGLVAAVPGAQMVAGRGRAGGDGAHPLAEGVVDGQGDLLPCFGQGEAQAGGAAVAERIGVGALESEPIRESRVIAPAALGAGLDLIGVVALVAPVIEGGEGDVVGGIGVKSGEGIGGDIADIPGGRVGARAGADMEAVAKQIRSVLRDQTIEIELSPAAASEAPARVTKSRCFQFIGIVMLLGYRDKGGAAGAPPEWR